MFNVYNNMKGGSNIQKVILKFLGLGILDNYQAMISIYDSSGTLVYSNKTYNGKLVLYLNEKKVYKLIAVSLRDIIDVSFYVSKDIEKYTFTFNRTVIKKDARTITFFLRDANYNNLPIEKGKIILCQK